jgi:hypothetical protein
MVGVSIYELIDVPLQDDERAVLRAGILEWGGPGRCTFALARAMGFRDEDDLLGTGRRIGDALEDHKPLSQRDWVRALLATEIVFASDVVGSGLDWPTTTGLPDDETIRILRQIQRKIPRGGYSRNVLLPPPTGDG